MNRITKQLTYDFGENLPKKGDTIEINHGETAYSFLVLAIESITWIETEGKTGIWMEVDGVVGNK